MKRKLPIVGLAAMFVVLPLAACGEKSVVPVGDGIVFEEPADMPEQQLPLAEPNEAEEPQVEVEPETPVEEPNENGAGEEQVPTVAEPQTPEAPQTKAAVYVRTLTNGLNVRAGAGTSSASLGTLEKGVMVEFVKKTDDWYETRYRGRTAYVSAKQNYTELYSMELDEESEKIENVIKVGLRYLGVEYVYGATRYHDGKGNKLRGFTTDAFDCSSLQQYMFCEGANTLLDVTTRTQVLQGKTVARKDIKRGDLLFFTNASRANKTGTERVGHVALYLGDNYILHTASDYAKIEQITTARWNYYITARRVV